MWHYLRALKNYSQTPKGKHDLIDYSKAIVLIILTTMIIIATIKILIINWKA